MTLENMMIRVLSFVLLLVIGKWREDLYKWAKNPDWRPLQGLWLGKSSPLKKKKEILNQLLIKGGRKTRSLRRLKPWCFWSRMLKKRFLTPLAPSWFFPFQILSPFFYFWKDQLFPLFKSFWWHHITHWKGLATYKHEGFSFTKDPTNFFLWLLRSRYSYFKGKETAWKARTRTFFSLRERLDFILFFIT